MQISISRLSWRAQAGAAVAVSAAGAVCFHSFWVQPARAAVAAQERALIAVRRDLGQAALTAKRLPEARGLVAELTRRLAQMRGEGHAQGDPAAALRAAQALAEASGLWITSFKPVPALTPESVSESSVALEFEGTYAAVMAFLQGVAEDSRVITVSRLRLQGQEQPSDETTVTGGCRLTTYVPQDAPAATPPAVTPRPAATASGEARASAPGLP
jgi:Tfp pilus assembly protein PilO